MELENSFLKMVIHMTVTLKMDKYLVMVFSLEKMGINTRDNGKMIKSTDKE